jgi:hypothetical protein
VWTEGCLPRAHQPLHQHAALLDLVAWLLTLIVKERIGKRPVRCFSKTSSGR